MPHPGSTPSVSSAIEPRTDAVRVAIWPAYRKVGDNAYTGLFADALARHGAAVTEFGPRTALAQHHALIVHWPEIALNRRSGVQRLCGAGVTLAALAAQRVRRTAVVWVTHNPAPHDGSGWIGRPFYRVLDRLVSGAIHPSHSSRAAARAVLPSLAERPSVVFPIGPYPVANVAPDRRHEILTELGLLPEHDVACCFGQVRRYKGTTDLVRAFRDVGGESRRLVITGRCSDAGLHEELVSLAAQDGRVILRLEHVAVDVLETLVARADLVAIAFREVLNSSSVVQALSLGTPVYCPYRGALGELAAAVGPTWMREMELPVSADGLDGAMDWARATERRGRPLSSFDWDASAAQVVPWLAALRGREGS